ncbi:hypothetical protein [Companilactobacillus sp.]|jgi:hypothetical protein|uniref:hypothetical protein n=1 Tax=Companilactobacillus sp. TaxID=2767905 RepID=UPI0025BAE61C|nr:hypothetical protein [Companilactobacillus sp.]MCH4008128.1 hypothetical protein [Companilactobacillus sp.]MCH4051693.1 hypothetical protein [Companilactobacillus sp.]MCH4076071.1 hypothetical protein [Companilactobacillus sp.]MCH4124646.1 hypothetical protein [Companilactobacillus sp.]MCH4132391.1 hypothetical protein [Companilactobacillus sp.]
MKVKSLINELKKYDPNAEVDPYPNSSQTPLWIPDYDLDNQVFQSHSIAEEIPIKYCPMCGRDLRSERNVR